jgi:hypothetical protein
VEATDAETEWRQPEQANPPIGDRQGQQRGHGADRCQHADADKLTCNDGSRPKRAIRKERGQQQNVVNICRRKDDDADPDDG